MGLGHFLLVAGVGFEPTQSALGAGCVVLILRAKIVAYATISHALSLQVMSLITHTLIQIDEA